MSGIEHLRFFRFGTTVLGFSMLLPPLPLRGGEQPTIEEMKARVEHASMGERPVLCIRISEAQLDAAARFYIAGDSEKAQAALDDTVAFARKAGDSAVQSHRHEKQSEIAIRKMAHKLADLKHTVSHEDQERVQAAIEDLERIRDNLLIAMFPKGVKK